MKEPFHQDDLIALNPSNYSSNKITFVDSVLHIVSFRGVRRPSQGAPPAPTSPGLQTDRTTAAHGG